MRCLNYSISILDFIFLLNLVYFLIHNKPQSEIGFTQHLVGAVWPSNIYFYFSSKLVYSHLSAVWNPLQMLVMSLGLLWSHHWPLHVCKDLKQILIGTRLYAASGFLFPATNLAEYPLWTHISLPNLNPVQGKIELFRNVKLTAFFHSNIMDLIICLLQVLQNTCCQTPPVMITWQLLINNTDINVIANKRKIPW